MRRWFLLLALGHIAGSYAFELVDRVVSWDIYAASDQSYAIETLAAPMRAVPFLIRHTLLVPTYEVEMRFKILIWWMAYLLPLAASVAVAICWGSQRHGSPSGFAPILSGLQDTGSSSHDSDD